MILSSVRRVLIRGPDGNTIWRETSQLDLPKGGKKLTFISGSIGVLAIVFMVALHGTLQSEINPDSKWGSAFRTLSTEPLRWLGADKTQNLPAPSHSSHLQ